MTKYGSFQRMVRLQRGLTQKELADRLGITEQAVGEWERGNAWPTRVPPLKIAEALEVSEHAVLDALAGRLPGQQPGFQSATGGDPTERRILDVLSRISKDDLEQLCDFAEYLASRRERREWAEFGLRKLAEAYGNDEPEYTLADLKP